MNQLRAPFPYYGGKGRVADVVWSHLGDPDLYIEPFCGSAAVLLARPSAPGRETINDIDGLVSNVWRAIQLAPDEVARVCDWPVSELDLHARHSALIAMAPSLPAQLEADPLWCDPVAAGWWVWGASQWIGGGWCRTAYRRRPQAAAWNNGRGVHAVRQRPEIHAQGGRGVHAEASRDHLSELMRAISHRLRHVRILCGDWRRPIAAPSSLDAGATAWTAIFLDPPYSSDTGRKRGLYRCEAYDSSDVRAAAVALSQRPRTRVALCGLDDEHSDLDALGWRRHTWRSTGGAVTGANEVVWFSPSCASGQLDLFEAGGAA